MSLRLRWIVAGRYRDLLVRPRRLDPTLRILDVWCTGPWRTDDATGLRLSFTTPGLKPVAMLSMPKFQRVSLQVNRDVLGDPIASPIARPDERRSVLARFGLVAVGLAIGSAASAGDQALQISNARVHAAERMGVDLPLLMTIKNDAEAPDALLRVRCPFANFSEKHTVDRGEGAPAMRAISSIPIATGNTLELKPDGYHVMLLQTRQTLAEGEIFTCSVVFQKAGSIETEVRVHRSE